MGKKNQKNVLQIIFSQAMEVRSLLFILGFIFSTTWLATTIYDVFKKVCGDNWTFVLLSLVSVGILYGLFLYSNKLQKQFDMDDKIDINSISEKSKKVLILFLSEIPDDFFKKPYFNTNIEKWLNPEEGFNSWKMPYKAINGHKSTLEKIYVLTSSKTTDKYKKFNQFVVNAFAPRKFSMEEMKIEDINNIEEYNSIFNTIYQASKEYEEDDIVIDVTSGRKLYSIAGSYFALSTEKITQYVLCNKKFDDKKDTCTVYQFNNKVLLDNE